MSATVAGPHTSMLVIYDNYYQMHVVTFVPYNLGLVNEYLEAMEEIVQERNKNNDDNSGAW